MSLRTFGRWDTPGMKLVVDASAKGPTVLTGQAATPVGALPAGWTRRRLGDLGRTYGGLAGKTGADFGRGSARYITFLNVMTNPVIDPRLFEPVVVHPYEHQNEVRKGDLIFNGSSETPEEVAMCSLLDHDVNGVYLNSFCFGFRLDDPDVDGLYLVNFFRSHEGRKLVLPLAQGFTRHNLSKRALLNLTIPVPPLGEQRAIRRALTDADHFNQELDGLIAKKRAMKQGAMQQLLTGRTRLPGFKEPWTSERLGETFSFLRTANNPRAELASEGDVVYVHYGDIHLHTSPVLDLEATSMPRIPARKVSAADRLQDGDLIFVDASEDVEGLAKAVEVRNVGGRDAVAGLHTILVRPDRRYWASGFTAYLQFMPGFRSAVKRVAAGISVYAISARQIGQIETPIPSVPEQQATAAVLADIEAELGALDQHLEKAQAVRQGMAQALLSGRVRLTELKHGA